MEIYVSRNFPFFIECFARALSDIGIYFDELKENKDRARHPLRESQKDTYLITNYIFRKSDLVC